MFSVGRVAGNSRISYLAEQQGSFKDDSREKPRARARALVDAERQSRIRHAVESPLAVTRWPRDRPRLTQNRECNERDDQFLTGRNGIDTRRAASATRASGPKVGGT